jgi:uncharacterized CHY-type Zn-finger protein
MDSLPNDLLKRLDTLPNDVLKHFLSHVSGIIDSRNLPNIISTLPKDLLKYLFSHVERITDARNLSKVCTVFRDSIGEHIEKLKIAYQNDYVGGLNDYLKMEDGAKEKYTVEIILDGYCHLLPEHYYSPDNKIICSALAFVGNLELLKVAKKRKCPIDNYTIRCASYRGHIDVLELLIGNCLKYYECEICHEAVISLQLKVLDWYQIKVGICPLTVQRYAMKEKQILVLDWMEQNNIHVRIGDCFTSAVRTGYVPLLRWAKNKNSEPYAGFYNDAVENGHPGVLLWALENNYLRNVPDWTLAISKEHTNVLDWAIEHGYVLNSSFYEKVVDSDKTTILEWTRKHNIELNKSLCDLAVSNKNHNVLEWMIKTKMITKPVSMVIIYQTLDTASILLKNNLLQLDTDTYLHLIKYGLILFDAINEEYFITKKQYHFVIYEMKIKQITYGPADDCSNQKIICCDHEGNYISDGFNCGHRCWWYFWLFSQLDERKFLDKIFNCDVHQKYISNLK